MILKHKLSSHHASIVRKGPRILDVRPLESVASEGVNISYRLFFLFSTSFHHLTRVFPNRKCSTDMNIQGPNNTELRNLNALINC
jgi:hypothetical protein